MLLISNLHFFSLNILCYGNYIYLRCQNIFEPRCDCGILYLHKYPKKNFSSSFGNMKSLMKLNVFDSPLEELPSKFVENHKRLVHLQFMKTGLRQLPIELGGWGESMLNLWISDSNLQSIPSSTEGTILRFQHTGTFASAIPDSCCYSRAHPFKKYHALPVRFFFMLGSAA